MKIEPGFLVGTGRNERCVLFDFETVAHNTVVDYDDGNMLPIGSIAEQVNLQDPGNESREIEWGSLQPALGRRRRYNDITYQRQRARARVGTYATDGPQQAAGKVSIERPINPQAPDVD